MKFLVMMMVAMMAVSCAHKHGTCNHDTTKTECACGTEKSADHKCEGCAHKEGQKCDHGHKHDHNHGKTEASTNPLMGEMLTQKISKEDFTKLYTTHQEKLGKTCTTPATKYCGKTTKDMMVSESEAICLWTKVFRTTRESLPALDGTPCARTIKGLVTK